ncbi:GTP pyrophosphokinase family protein [Duganella sp. FT27W]|uniref:GTP pyrophosphokinase n=1 Tax=Duganella sp. FT27W TaxID=2654636 RepID=UPI00128DAA13|nr:hypothetical protein [Duganella sp. FT27W]MPQ57480.1 hypothetical protein [Duganella sp. FT27W]
MNSAELRIEYDKRLPTYIRASNNIQDAIALLIKEKGIAYLAVLSRVKSFESFKEKIEKKRYDSPFSQATDFVGIRVILYFPKDVILVREILSEEFNILESSDKSDLLKSNEFGYRSHHLLLRTPGSWLSTPNYRGLGDVTVEVQIRTILMHAWAEIEHKLQYKSNVQVPSDLQRKLFLLSAKVEEADDQFQNLVADVNAYRHEIAIKVSSEGKFDSALDLNLDTLKEFLLFFYPESETHDAMTQNLFDDIVKYNITLPQLVDYATRFAPYRKELKDRVSGLPSAAELNYAIDVFAPKFSAPGEYTRGRNKIIRELRELAQTVK